MLWYKKLDRLKKIMLRNFLSSAAAYHIAFLISYLAIWLEISFYDYYHFNMMLIAIYTTNGIILWIYLKKTQITRRFSNRMMALQMVNWFTLFAIWSFFMVEQKAATLICALMALSFLFSYSTLFYSTLLSLAVSIIHLSTTYIGINYFEHPNLMSHEIINTVAFFSSSMLIAAILHRLASLLRNQASNDHLTKLFNRRSMTKQIKTEYQRCIRFDIPASLVMIDLDDFKLINDTYGHEGGDAVLINVAQTLKNELRLIDYVARWGGEEFLALLVGINPSDAKLAIERILVLLNESPLPVGKHDIPVSFSAGIVALAGFESSELAIKEADRLLYLAKNEGKGRVFY